MSHVSWHQTYLRRFDCVQDCNNSYNGRFILANKAVSKRSRIFLPGVIIKQDFINKNPSRLKPKSSTLLTLYDSVLSCKLSRKALN